MQLSPAGPRRRVERRSSRDSFSDAGESCFLALCPGHCGNVNVNISLEVRAHIDFGERNARDNDRENLDGKSRPIARLKRKGNPSNSKATLHLVAEDTVARELFSLTQFPINPEEYREIPQIGSKLLEDNC
jgi:hypothetical protein